MAFWRSYAHLVWATKNRDPFIRPQIEANLYAQIVKTAAELGCYVHSINGMPDHTHLAISIPPKHAVAYVVKMLKGSSAHFVNHILRPVEYHFAWQRGYGYLTLGQSQLPTAIAYVQQQKEHHRLGSTNGWLERYDDLDEGPDFIPTRTEEESVLKETVAVYQINEQSPF